MPVNMPDEIDNVIEMFVVGLNERIATYRNNQDDELHYYLNDQVGSARVTMFGEAGSATPPYVAEYINSHPFGGTVEQVGSYQSDFKFTSKEYDDHSTFKFHYFGARYYDDRTGQFIGVDKVGFRPPVSSTYAYCANDPYRNADPDGNDWWRKTDGLYWYDAGPDYSGPEDYGTYYAPEINYMSVHPKGDKREFRFESHAVDPSLPNQSFLPDVTERVPEFVAKVRDFFSGVVNPYTFRDNVKAGSWVDVKRVKGSPFNSTDHPFVFYEGKAYRADTFGNYFFGVGASEFWLTNIPYFGYETMHEEAGAVQENPRPEWKEAWYGDDPQDWYYIDMGYYGHDIADGPYDSF